jgi:hypothetical protein
VAASARQLDRDIHSTLTRSLRRWSSYGGGPLGRKVKRRYDRKLPEGTYEIAPVSSREGRHLGYELRFTSTEPTPPAWLRGWRGAFLGVYSSPEEAAIAAAEHYAEVF